MYYPETAEWIFLDWSLCVFIIDSARYEQYKVYKERVFFAVCQNFCLLQDFSWCSVEPWLGKTHIDYCWSQYWRQNRDLWYKWHWHSSMNTRMLKSACLRATHNMPVPRSAAWCVRGGWNSSVLSSAGACPPAQCLSYWFQHSPEAAAACPSL
jgi:hypothetical protein